MPLSRLMRPYPILSTTDPTDFKRWRDSFTEIAILNRTREQDAVRAARNNLKGAALQRAKQIVHTTIMTRNRTQHTRKKTHMNAPGHNPFTLEAIYIYTHILHTHVT